jgi:hypothetical protein
MRRSEPAGLWWSLNANSYGKATEKHRAGYATALHFANG